MQSTNIGWKDNIIQREFRSRSKSPAGIDTYIYNIGKYLFKEQIFYGHLQEKRFVNSLNTYRDLIVVNNKENDFIKKLQEFKRLCNENIKCNKKWLGITDPNTIGTPSGYCIWTDIDLPFGEYYFQIKKVVYKENEIFLQLKYLKDYKEPQQIPEESISQDPKEYIEELFLYCSSKLTLENFIIFCKYFILIIISLMIFCWEGIQRLGVFTLQFMKHFNNFIKAITPAFLGCLDLIKKIIGGIFIIIAMIWRDFIEIYFGKKIDRTNQPNYLQSPNQRPMIMPPNINKYNSRNIYNYPKRNFNK